MTASRQGRVFFYAISFINNPLLITSEYIKLPKEKLLMKEFFSFYGWARVYIQIIFMIIKLLVVYQKGLIVISKDDILDLKKLTSKEDDGMVKIANYLEDNKEKAYAFATANTCYKDGHPVISKDDEWNNESEWDELYVMMCNERK